MCPKPKCNCQKDSTFSAAEFQLERRAFRNTAKKYSEGVKKQGTAVLNQQ